MVLKNDWGSGDYFTSADQNAVADEVNAKADSAGLTTSVLDYGADPTGGTDSTVAIEDAWTAGAGNIYFPPGTYLYNGSGLTGEAYINTRIVGSGSSRKSRIYLGEDSYLLVLDMRIDSIEMSDLEILNGKGAIKLTWTGQNVNNLNLIRNVRFRDYTECAIANDANDMPYWRITDCVFWGANTSSTIGMALSGLTDSSIIDRCSFVNNRIAIKMRKGGNNAHIDRCDFLFYTGPLGPYPEEDPYHPRSYIWLVPTPTKTNSGAGFVVNECRIGNENKVEGDKVIIYADEEAGTSNGTRFPVLDADSTGWVMGHQIIHCALHGSSDVPVPLIYSTTPNVEHLTVAHCTIKGQPPSYLLEFRTPTTVPDRGNSKNLFGPFTGEVETEVTPSMPVSNAVGMGYTNDPTQMLQTRPDVIRSNASGTSSSYRSLMSETISEFAINENVTSDPRTDSFGGTEAALLTFSTASTGSCLVLTDAMTVGVPAWVEVDVKQGDTGTPLEMLRIQVADTTGSAIHWRRIVAVPDSGWVTFAFSFIPRTVGANPYLLIDNRANGTAIGTGDPGTVIVGRPRFYQANERQLGGRRPTAPTAATTLSDAQSVTNDLRNELIAQGVLSGTPSSPSVSLEKAYFSAAELADGILPATGVLDSGQPYVVTHASSTGFDIVDGALQTDVSLAYLNFGPLQGPIREFDMVVSWTDGGEGSDETAVIIVADGPFADNYPTSYANAGAHVLLDRTIMSFQRRRDDGGDSETMLSHTYGTALAYDVPHRFRVMWSGTTASVIDPYGVNVAIPTTDTMRDWWGPYGCAEIVGAASGKNKVNIHSFSTTSDPAVPKGSTLPTRLLGAMQTSADSVETAITTSLSAKLFELNVPIPASRHVFITGSVWLDQAVPVVRAASQLVLGVYVAGVGAHGKLTTLYYGYTPANATADETLFANRQGDMVAYENGILIPFSLELTLNPSFAVGSTWDFQVKMQASANDQWTFVDSGGGTGFAGIRRSSMMIYELPA